MNRLLIYIILLIVSAVSTGCGDSAEQKKNPSLDTSKSSTILEFDNFKKDGCQIEELNLSDTEKEVLLTQIWEHYEWLDTESYSEIANKSIKDCFSFLELNQDGIPDIIFQGWSGGEGDWVRIHFSEKGSYRKPTDLRQYMKNIEVLDGKIKHLTIVNYGCCAEYVEEEIRYSFDDRQNHWAEIHRARIGALADKYEILDTPIPFTVENDVYKLRGEPLIDDTSTFNYDHYKKGNTVAIFPKGSIGIAWAIDNSDPEREWWYVEMEPIAKQLKFDMFYFDDPTGVRRFGWMSSRFLKKN